MIGWLLGAALASELVVSGAVGWESPVRQTWTGLDVALRSHGEAAWQPVGRLSGGLGVYGVVPFTALELGVVRRVPAQGATVRVGVAARGVFTGAEYRFPLTLRDAELRLGAYGGAMGLLEFEWGEVAPYGVGLRLGPSSATGTSWCADGQDSAVCTTWHPGANGGFYARKRWENGLAAEVVIGPTSSLTLGRALGVAR